MVTRRAKAGRAFGVTARPRALRAHAICRRRLRRRATWRVTRVAPHGHRRRAAVPRTPKLDDAQVMSGAQRRSAGAGEAVRDAEGCAAARRGA
jgi:hypothetical protein